MFKFFVFYLPVLVASLNLFRLHFSSLSFSGCLFPPFFFFLSLYFPLSHFNPYLSISKISSLFISAKNAQLLEQMLAKHSQNLYFPRTLSLLLMLFLLLLLFSSWNAFYSAYTTHTFMPFIIVWILVCSLVAFLHWFSGLCAICYVNNFLLGWLITTQHSTTLNCILSQCIVHLQRFYVNVSTKFMHEYHASSLYILNFTSK